MKSPDISRISAANLHLVEDLYKNVYGRTAGLNYFHRKYSTPFSGYNYLGFLATESDRPVSFMGMVPALVSIGGKAVAAAQPADGMTLPQYRRKGFYVELMQRTIELAKQGGIEFLYAFPNESALSVIVNRLGFSHSGDLGRYAWPLKRSLKKTLKKMFFGREPRDNPDRFENILVKEGYDGVIYDSRYLAYKRYNRNFFSGRSDCELWLHHSEGLWVGAIDRLPQNGMQPLVNMLSERYGASSVTFMVSQGTGLAALLTQARKTEPGFPIVLKNLSGKYSTDQLRFQFADLDIF